MGPNVVGVVGPGFLNEVPALSCAGVVATCSSADFGIVVSVSLHCFMS